MGDGCLILPIQVITRVWREDWGPNLSISVMRDLRNGGMPPNHYVALWKALVATGEDM